MALGISGEMYGNFGRWGGVFGVFCYSLLIGAILGVFFRLGKSNILWWSWAPFMLLPTLEAEWNLVDTLNYITKSALVMIILINSIPFLRVSLFKRRAFLPSLGGLLKPKGAVR